MKICPVAVAALAIFLNGCAGTQALQEATVAANRAAAAANASAQAAEASTAASARATAAAEQSAAASDRNTSAVIALTQVIGTISPSGRVPVTLEINLPCDNSGAVCATRYCRSIGYSTGQAVGWHDGMMIVPKVTCLP